MKNFKLPYFSDTFAEVIFKRRETRIVSCLKMLRSLGMGRTMTVRYHVTYIANVPNSSDDSHPPLNMASVIMV